MIKRTLLSFAMVLVAMVGALAQNATFTVQGHARPDLEQRIANQKLMSGSKMAAPAVAATPQTFSFSDIKFWVGEGENQAALVVDWHDPDGKLDHSYVWGFRWPAGTQAFGYDMVAAVAKADPRFTFMTHETNLGNTICGLGYDVDYSGNIQILHHDEVTGEKTYHSPVDGIVYTHAYNYDEWWCTDPNDLWMSGWYTRGYWSYQVKDAQEAEWGYSGLGASSRELVNGSWDAWSFADFSGMTGSLPREPFEAASTPEREPTDNNTYWGQMYKNPQHQSIVDLPLAIEKKNVKTAWEFKFTNDKGNLMYNGQPIIAGDYMYNTAGNKIYKISILTGELAASGVMDGSIGFFSMLAYGDGKIFVTLNSGKMQAFDAVTLESVWTAQTADRGQQLCPIVYHDGRVYTGTWGRPGKGVYYCLTTSDDDPYCTNEVKNYEWQTESAGYYWSGGTIVGDNIYVGNDLGQMLAINRISGKVIDKWVIAPDLKTSTIRSGTSYDAETGRLYFTGKETKKLYSVVIKADGKFDTTSIMSADVAGQATTTPTVYRGRVYVTSGTMTSGGGFDVFDAATLKKIYTVDLGGISQSTPVVSTAYACEANKYTVYIYICLNNRTGDMVCIKDFQGNTTPTIQYKWQAPKTQYCTHSMVVDQYGKMYYKNDSKGFWALSSEFSVDSIVLAHKELNIPLDGKFHYIVPTVYPDFATNKAINWTSQYDSIGTVDINSRIMPKAFGTTVVTATSVDGGKTATCTVNVVPQKLEGVKLSKKEVTLAVGKRNNLYLNFTPTYATNQNVTWSVLDPKVVSIVPNGRNCRIEGVSFGETMVIAESEEGNFKDTCLVKIFNGITKVTINKDTLRMKGGETFQLTYTLTPSENILNEAKWSSNSRTICTVDELTGVVTALNKGTARVSVTTTEGRKRATCVVIVEASALTGIEPVKAVDTIYIGQGRNLRVKYLPEYATNKDVTWRSGNDKIAKINSMSGYVTPVEEGVVDIFAKSAEGGFEAKIELHVLPINVTEVTLSDTLLNLTLDSQPYKIVATVAPENATIKDVAWTNTNESVVRVLDGEVTPLAPGTAILRATAASRVYKECKVVVDVNATSITISDADTVTISRPYQLNATVLPANATLNSVLWASANAFVASVDQSGLVTPMSDGVTTIKAYAMNGTLKAERIVKVVIKKVTGITLDKAVAAMKVNETLKLKASIAPADATNQDLIWTSSADAVASVSADGLVTALTAGEATITVTTADGNFTAQCVVTVTKPVTGVTLDKATAAMKVNETLQLTATIEPADASNQGLIWTSSADAVASVSADGLVTALTAGEATIIVTTADGNFTAQCVVTVTKPVTGVTLDKATAAMKVNETLQLTATIEPADASNQELIWTSSADAVASVSADGLVTALTAGEATITVTTADGNFTAQCVVTVEMTTDVDNVVVLKSIYPNPVRDQLYIVSDKSIDIQIYDINGHLLVAVPLVEGENVINVSTLPSGVYMIKCGDETHKIVKR